MRARPAHRPAAVAVAVAVAVNAVRHSIARIRVSRYCSHVNFTKAAGRERDTLPRGACGSRAVFYLCGLPAMRRAGCYSWTMRLARPRSISRAVHDMVHDVHVHTFFTRDKGHRNVLASSL